MSGSPRAVRFYGSTDSKEPQNQNPKQKENNGNGNNQNAESGASSSNGGGTYQNPSGSSSSDSSVPSVSVSVSASLGSPRPTKSIFSLASGVSNSTDAAPLPQFPKRTSRPPSISHSNPYAPQSSVHFSDSSDSSDSECEWGQENSKRRFDLMVAKSPTLFNLFSHTEEEEKQEKEAETSSGPSLRPPGDRGRRRSFSVTEDERRPLLPSSHNAAAESSDDQSRSRSHSHSHSHSHDDHAHSHSRPRSLSKHRRRSQGSLTIHFPAPPVIPFYVRWHEAAGKFLTDLYNSELFEQLTNPLGKHRRLWLLVIFAFALYNAISIPLRLAFRELWQEPQYFILFYVLDYFGDFVFLLDVGLNFFTPFTHEMVYERNLTQIRIHYFRTWFIPDLISSVPIDSLFIALGADGKTVLLIRFTRFLRFIKYDQYFKVWEQYATRAPQLIRFAKLTLGMLLILHWLGCMWIFCGYEYGFGTSTWLPGIEVYQSSVFSQYLFAFWWATNIITQVGGDPGLPTTDVERCLDIFVAFLATFVVAIVIGNVSELVSELNADENNMRQKLQNLNHFMYTRRLPDELQNRIRNYFMNLWSRQGGVDDSNIMEELPSSLRTEVSLVMNQDILGKVPIFSNSSEGFINSLVAHLKPQTYAPKEFIVRQGDIGSEMYFISRGQVNVIANEKVVGTIKEGGFFGEISVLSDQSQRTASIQAVNFVDVFVLTHADMQMMFRSFPAEKAVILRVADTRRAKDLLRKALQDENLFIREHLKGFNCDPGFVSLLMDLFTPVDLFASDSPVMDEEGNLDLDSFGYVFGPHNTADTIYFIGKGCVNVFASRNPPSPGEDGVVFEGNEEEEEEEPEFVCSLKEGDFVGEIGSDFYSVWAVVPYEYRRETIIFALSATDLQPIHDYYEKHFKNDPKMRKRIKRALICLLQRHRSAEDYRQSKAPPPPKAAEPGSENADPTKRNLQTLWKSVSKVVGFGVSSHKRISSLTAAAEGIDTHTLMHEAAKEEFRSGTADGETERRESEDESAKEEKTGSESESTQAQESVSPLPELTSERTSQAATTMESLPVIFISPHEDSPSPSQPESRQSINESEALARPSLPRSSSLPPSSSVPDLQTNELEASPDSTAETPEARPASQSLSIPGHHAIDLSDIPPGRPHSSSLPWINVPSDSPVSPALAPVTTSPVSSSAVVAPAVAPSRSGSHSIRNSVFAARPPVIRALSTPMNLAPVDMNSPISSKPHSPRISPSHSPRSLSPRSGGSFRHSFNSLNDSPSFDPFSNSATVDSTKSLPRLRKMGSIFHAGRESLDNPDAMRNRRQSDIITIQRALASQQANPGPKASLPMLQLPKTPATLKRGSMMFPGSIQTAGLVSPQSASSSIQPISPSPLAPPMPNSNPGSRRGSIVSAVSPYSFLLQLPMMATPPATAPPVAAPATTTAAQAKSRLGPPHKHRRTPSMDSSLMNKPDLFRAGSKDLELHGKKSSISSMTPTSPGVPGNAPAASNVLSRRLEFLEKALGALGNDELLLLSNKANLLLFNRLQQQQQQIADLSGIPDPTKH